MINLQDEQAISLGQATKLLPTGRNGSHTCLSTVLRWVLDGVKLPGKEERVKLEASRLGGRWITSVEAIHRFMENLTPVLDDSKPAVSRTPTARTRASERAARALEKAGI